MGGRRFFVSEDKDDSWNSMKNFLDGLVRSYTVLGGIGQSWAVLGSLG